MQNLSLSVSVSVPVPEYCLYTGLTSFILHRCGSSVCFTCSHPLEAHVGKSCEELNEGDKSDDRGLLVSGNAKTCPYCNVMVAQHSACNCIQCNCTGFFCWLCGMGLGFKSDKAHSHFWACVEDCDEFDFSDDKPNREMWRACCTGLMDGGAAKEYVYSVRNNKALFGLKSPYVKRGV